MKAIRLLISTLAALATAFTASAATLYLEAGRFDGAQLDTRTTKKLLRDLWLDRANGAGVAFARIVRANDMKTQRILIALAAALVLGVSSPAADKAKVESYRKAAEQGSVLDQTMLGGCYEYGNGVPKDAAEAVQWYRKAAEKGYRPAQILLGFCHKNGEGVATNEVEAVKWFRTAGEQGDRLGQYMLGFCYQYGKGVASNSVEALKWFNLSAAQDFDMAKKTQTEVGNQLKKEQIAEAKKLADEFKPKAP